MALARAVRSAVERSGARAKAAVHMLSRQLRVDLLGRMVRVTEICPGRVATEIVAHVHGDSAETRERFTEGFLLPQASDIAHAIAFALAALVGVNVEHIEIMPTLQVPGGLTTLRARRLNRGGGQALRPLGHPRQPRVPRHALD